LNVILIVHVYGRREVEKATLMMGVTRNTSASTPAIHLQPGKGKARSPRKDVENKHRSRGMPTNVSVLELLEMGNATHETQATSRIRRMQKRTSAWTYCLTRLRLRGAEEEWMKQCLCTQRELTAQLEDSVQMSGE